MSRCWAIRPQLTGFRCNKEAGEKWFCYNHQAYIPVLIASIFGIILSGCLVAYITGNVIPPTKREKIDSRRIEETEKLGHENRKDILEIKKLLQDKYASTNEPKKEEHIEAELNNYTDSKGLETKYPFGFALYYSDGHKTLFYDKSDKHNLHFNPSDVEVVNFSTSEICIDIQNMGLHNICFGGASDSVIHALKTDDFRLDFEFIGHTNEGAVWVIGVGPSG